MQKVIFVVVVKCFFACKLPFWKKMNSKRKTKTKKTVTVVLKQKQHVGLYKTEKKKTMMKKMQKVIFVVDLTMMV